MPRNLLTTYFSLHQEVHKALKLFEDLSLFKPVKKKFLYDWYLNGLPE